MRTSRMIHITHNPHELTEEERKVIETAPWYMYVYGVGLIIFPAGTWDCTATVQAKEYLDNLKIPERT